MYDLHHAAANDKLRANTTRTGQHTPPPNSHGTARMTAAYNRLFLHDTHRTTHTITQLTQNSQDHRKKQQSLRLHYIPRTTHATVQLTQNSQDDSSKDSSEEEEDETDNHDDATGPESFAGLPVEARLPPPTLQACLLLPFPFRVGVWWLPPLLGLLLQHDITALVSCVRRNTRCCLR